MAPDNSRKLTLDIVPSVVYNNVMVGRYTTWRTKMNSENTKVYIVNSDYGPDMLECDPWEYNELCTRLNMPLVNLCYGEDGDGYSFWYDADIDDTPIVLAELPADDE